MSHSPTSSRMPRGQNFIEFGSFQDAYETLKQETDAFARFSDETVWKALQRNALVFVVVRIGSARVRPRSSSSPALTVEAFECAARTCARSCSRPDARFLLLARWIG
jgi:hypothetical protein